jgi:N-acetylneuraminic acid mutarotase
MFSVRDSSWQTVSRLGFFPYLVPGLNELGQFRSVKSEVMHSSMLHIVIFLQAAFSVSGFPSNQQAKRNCWKELAPIKNGPRQEGGVAAIGKNIYVVGGMTQTIPRGQQSTVEVYDIDSNKWSNAPPMPVAMHHPNVAAANGSLYVLGGLTGSNPNRKTLGNVFRFNPAVGRWDELSPMPNGTARGASAVAVNGNLIYLAGGLQPQDGDVNYGQRVNDLVSSFDTKSEKWSTLPRLPEKRDHVGGAFIGDTLYVVGGRTGDVFSVKNTLFALKTNATEWKTLANMPTGRGGMAVAAIGTKIYTFSGEGNPAPGSNQVWPDIESYDTTTNKWQKESAMKNPRHGTGGVAVGDTIYIPGGGTAGGGGAAVAITEAYGPGNC